MNKNLDICRALEPDVYLPPLLEVDFLRPLPLRQPDISEIPTDLLELCELALDQEAKLSCQGLMSVFLAFVMSSERRLKALAASSMRSTIIVSVKQLTVSSMLICPLESGL